MAPVMTAVTVARPPALFHKMQLQGVERVVGGASDVLADHHGEPAGGIGTFGERPGHSAVRTVSRHRHEMAT